MRNLRVLLASFAFLGGIAAQDCSAPLGAQLLPTLSPFQSDFFIGEPSPMPSVYNGFAYFMDVELNCAVTIPRLDLWLYDDGDTPNQVGNVTTVRVWRCATTRTGRERTSSAWTLLGTGNLTVADSISDSIVTFATPLSIAAGRYGIAIQVLPPATAANTGNPNVANCGPLHPRIQTYVAGNGNQPGSGNAQVPTTARDRFLTVSNQTVARNWLLSDPLTNTPWANNLRFHHVPAATAGYHVAYGAGCYSHPVSWYEWFPAGATAAAMDLANLCVRASLGAARYSVAQGTSVIRMPTSNSLTLTPPAVGTLDDGLFAAITLPFAFPFRGPSGQLTTNQIRIGTNGIVYLSGTADNEFGSYPGVGAWLADAPSIALAFGDWDASGASGPVGGIHYEVDPTNTKAYVTFLSVPEWVNTPPATGSLTAQLVLHASGTFEVVYGTLARTAAGAPVIAGFTHGATSQDAGSRDLVSGGLVQAFASGDGAAPPSLGMDARPILGTTPNLVTTGVAASTQFTLVALGFAPQVPGFDLGVFGMPGCFQYVQPAVTNGGFFVGGVALTPLAIPNQTSLMGLNLRAQSAPFQAGENPAGILTTNAVCIRIGT